MDQMRILIIEDDHIISSVIRDALTIEGYAVDIADTGAEGEELAESIHYDLIILDILLEGNNKTPDKDGFQICYSLRQKKISTPVMLLTRVFIKESDQVKGLDCGADDYLTKPFHIPVLQARVRALLRREPEITGPLIYAGKLELDTVSRQVRLDQEEIILTQKEYTILEYLVRHSGQVVRRSTLEQQAWNIEMDSTSNVLDAHVKNLRKKLGDKVIIKAARGLGYRLMTK
jgi:two-component system, OmpR family, response regulator